MNATCDFIIGELYQLTLPDEYGHSHTWVWDICKQQSISLPTNPPIILLYLGLHNSLNPLFLIGNIPGCSNNFPINALIGSTFLPLVKPITNDSTERF